MDTEYNPRLKALILEVVDNQIRNNDPPITNKTVKRLRRKGYSQKKAKEMIGSVVVKYIYDILKYGDHFNEEQYARDLKELE